jgi:hypothetical protein
LALTLTKPFETAGQAPGVTGNYILLPLALIMLVLSLRNARDE